MRKFMLAATAMTMLAGCVSDPQSYSTQSGQYSQQSDGDDALMAIGLVLLTGYVIYEIDKDTRRNEAQRDQYQGNCQYEWQYASDGSRCGKRAASARRN